MPAPLCFITGTDTGVGKTVFTALLIRHLIDRGVKARAVKPLCSGGRADARVLASAQRDAWSLDDINPWHFRAPLAPLVAARLENRVVLRAAVVRYLRTCQRQCAVLLAEGAGGLMSPLGVDFNSLDLISSLGATPVVVCPNRLGVLNHALLSLAAFSKEARRRAKIVLVAQRRSDPACDSNVALLRELVGPERVVELPHLQRPLDFVWGLRQKEVQAALDAVVENRAAD